MAPGAYVNDFVHIRANCENTYYVSISTSMSSSNVLGIMDYSCGGGAMNCPPPRRSR